MSVDKSWRYYVVVDLTRGWCPCLLCSSLLTDRLSFSVSPFPTTDFQQTRFLCVSVTVTGVTFCVWSGDRVVMMSRDVGSGRVDHSRVLERRVLGVGCLPKTEYQHRIERGEWGWYGPCRESKMKHTTDISIFDNILLWWNDVNQHGTQVSWVRDHYGVEEYTEKVKFIYSRITKDEIRGTEMSHEDYTVMNLLQENKKSQLFHQLEHELLSPCVFRILL